MATHGLGGNQGLNAPDPAHNTPGGAPYPLVTGSLAAGERLARVTGHVGYTEMKCALVAPRVLLIFREGRDAEAELWVVECQADLKP